MVVMVELIQRMRDEESCLMSADRSRVCSLQGDKHPKHGVTGCDSVTLSCHCLLSAVLKRKFYKKLYLRENKLKTISKITVCSV